MITWKCHCKTTARVDCKRRRNRSLVLYRETFFGIPLYGCLSVPNKASTSARGQGEVWRESAILSQGLLWSRRHTHTKKNQYLSRDYMRFHAFSLRSKATLEVWTSSRHGILLWWRIVMIVTCKKFTANQVRFSIKDFRVIFVEARAGCRRM